jgi:hypothetical protein
VLRDGGIGAYSGRFRVTRYRNFKLAWQTA